MMTLYAIETRLLQLPPDALVPVEWALDLIADEWTGIQLGGAKECTRLAARTGRGPGSPHRRTLYPPDRPHFI